MEEAPKKIPTTIEEPNHEPTSSIYVSSEKDVEDIRDSPLKEIVWFIRKHKSRREAMGEILRKIIRLP
jgi:hypothetical protein